ncbi:TfoX/Sxy family protein [Streptomyces sp. ISL-44]|uniref:TfoX/Sxy family protein n=1 Tax=Streptomyces sp. ISL-44 TaxID=2819184 RepID=UPI001BEA31D6|nr:TfoX/Sxy family protein [Streptomyces sp. ISL-44]MBT2542666.1 TfoX/Sxy family protein [Streptomyces sp. ISL-44]
MTPAAARRHALAIADELQALGPVEVTRFFGGAGLSCNGRQFGFVMKGTLYLRVDNTTRPRFEEAGTGPFTYTSGPREVTVTAYYELPQSIAEDPEELLRWAADAYRTAHTARPRRPTARSGRRRDDSTH